MPQTPHRVHLSSHTARLPLGAQPIGCAVCVPQVLPILSTRFLNNYDAGFSGKVYDATNGVDVTEVRHGPTHAVRPPRRAPSLGALLSAAHRVCSTGQPGRVGQLPLHHELGPGAPVRLGARQTAHMAHSPHRAPST